MNGSIVSSTLGVLLATTLYSCGSGGTSPRAAGAGGTENQPTRGGRVWEYGYPNAEKITREPESYLKDNFERFEEAIDDDKFSDPANGGAKWLDEARSLAQLGGRTLPT